MNIILTAASPGPLALVYLLHCLIEANIVSISFVGSMDLKCSAILDDAVRTYTNIFTLANVIHIGRAGNREHDETQLQALLPYSARSPLYDATQCTMLHLLLPYPLLQCAECQTLLGVVLFTDTESLAGWDTINLPEQRPLFEPT